MDAGTWFKVITGLIGGVGLFLYGMKLMSDGLQKTAGDKLKLILEKLTSNRVIGMFVGMVVTVLMQSSTATTVMVVGFVNAGMMNLTQALGIVLGANVGTTVTAQIIAFKVTAFSGIMIGIGAVMVLFMKKTNVKYVGEIFLGFGMLFMGMSVMTDAFTPLNNSDTFKVMVLSFSNYPLLAVIVGTVVTMLLQSSSATIGITIALATTGLIDFQTSVALVLGDNIGTTLTANIAAIGGSRTAKQAAFGHFLYNLIGVTYMMFILTPFVAFVEYLTPGDASTMAGDGTYPYMARHIANAHTIFNIINCAVFLPILPLLAKMCEKIIRSDVAQKYKFTKLSDAMLSTPEIAFSQFRNEVGRMSTIAMQMLNDAERAILKNDKSKMSKISEYEQTLDGFKNELIDFLDKLHLMSVSQKVMSALDGLRQVTHSLEEIGDQALKLMKITSKMLDKKQTLSKSATKELNQMFDVVNNFASVTFKAFYTNRVQTEEELAFEDEIDKMHKAFRKNHIKRLNKGLCNVEIGIHFVDILNYLEKIGDHIFSVAQINLTEGKR